MTMLTTLRKAHLLFKKRWYFLPIFSGVLFVLAFHPFDFWPLAFVCLTPLYYFVAGYPERSYLRIFLAGGIAGGVFAFALSYFTLVQFNWLPEAYLFTDLVRLAVIPITILGAVICGSAGLLYRFLRSDSIILNALVGAAAYTGSELTMRAIFGGYYFGLLGYAASHLISLMSFAAIGGAPLVSFIVALVNAFFAEGIASWQKQRRKFVISVSVCIAALLILFAANQWYLSHPSRALGSLFIAVVQEGDRNAITFGTEKDGSFSSPMMQRLVTEAAAGHPDLLIYPFSPVEGALYRGDKPPFNKNILIANEGVFGAWLRPLAGTSTVMTWDTVYSGEKFLNEYEFWQEGKVVSEYTKRKLFPFMDYTPEWAQRIGLYSTPYDATPGAPDNHASLNGIPVGSLLCSELDRADLARRTAATSSLIIAAGSEAMFVDDIASEFSVRAAQFRAAENHVPVVRGNMLGPSVIIGADGSILSEVPTGQEGVAKATLSLREPQLTFFTRFGAWPLYLFLCSILAIALWQKRKR